ncbi:hypothetical protein GCM10009618_19450 [Nesterenkonia lacusekhoensis]
MDPWMGSEIDGRYVIEDRVARGGMSTVYVAQDRRLGRRVALKVLFPHMAEDRKVVERFEQEARNSALISHPNVVQVLDQGQTRETAYLVMEYVPGATLRTLLKKGPMTPRLALTYLEAILGGLGAAHRAGLVHRDIKPENVLVSRDGSIKLADFGLARAATHHSGTSTLMGTVAYISPELLSGEGADERADIYATGILLYEMLTGVQPYTGDSPVRVAFQHVNSTVPDPSQYAPGLAQPLDELVTAATAPKMVGRPKNADEFLALLRSTRAELTDAQLDFDGALRKHRRHHGEPAQEPAPQDDAAAGTAVLGSAPTASPSAVSAESPGMGEDAGLLPEDFPTREEPESWDDDVDAALGHARPAGSWSTLAEQDRQTVAEVPTMSYAAPEATYTPQAQDETTQFSAVGRGQGQASTLSAEAAEDSARSEQRQRRPEGRKDRQRPTIQLQSPTPTRAWLTVAIVMIVGSVVTLLAWFLGLSPAIVPSLGGPQ